MPSKKPSVAEAFVRSPQSATSAGRHCLTCVCPVRAQLEQELAVYNEARRTGRTTASWQRFHAVLVAHLGIKIKDWKSLVRHMRSCLGWEVH